MDINKLTEIFSANSVFSAVKPERERSSLTGFTPLEKAARRVKNSLTGFTIIELIVVITIIVVASGIGSVSFTALIRDTLEADSRKIVSEFCWARQSAFARHFNYIVSLDTINENYIIYEDRDADAIPDADEETARRQLGADIVLVTDLLGVPIAPVQITFDFLNGASQDRLINLSYSGRTRQIRVFGNTGYVKIQ